MSKYCIRSETGRLIATINLTPTLQSQLFEFEAGRWVKKNFAYGLSENCFELKDDFTFRTSDDEIYLYSGYYLYKL